jgi:hypothetical protein
MSNPNLTAQTLALAEAVKDALLRAQEGTEALKAALAGATDEAQPGVPPEPADGSIVMVPDDRGEPPYVWHRDDGLGERRGLARPRHWFMFGEAIRVAESWPAVVGRTSVVVLYEPGVQRVVVPDPEDPEAVERIQRVVSPFPSDRPSTKALRGVLRTLREGSWRS